MYKYEEPSLFSGRRGAALIAVIILHIGPSGRSIRDWPASSYKRSLIPPVGDRADRKTQRHRQAASCPPAKLEEIKPYVPPPEFVDIQAPQQETNAITQTTTVNLRPPPPVVAAAPPKPGTPIHEWIRAHPLKIGEDYYPDRVEATANEEGRCVVLMTVAADGRITNESIQQSSGFPRLDEACFTKKACMASASMLPASEEGNGGREKTVSIPIVWRTHGQIGSLVQ